jgi:uncharacterized protein YerC
MLRSLEVLDRLRTIDIPFVVIGGWAVYLFTHYHMSRDLDLIMEQKDLWKLRSFVISQGGTEKAPGLSKYGYKLGQVDMDVYTEEKGDIIPSPGEILSSRRFIEVERYRVVEPEILLLLKVRAATDRAAGLKGLKDRCDVISLLNSGRIDLDKFAAESRRHAQADAVNRVLRIVEMANEEYEYVLGRRPTPQERWRLKREMIPPLRRLGPR